MYKTFFINIILINVCFGLEYLSPTYFFNQKNNSSSDIIIQTEGFSHLIGIMGDFQIEREEFEDNIQTHDICEITGLGGSCGV